MPLCYHLALKGSELTLLLPSTQSSFFSSKVILRQLLAKKAVPFPSLFPSLRWDLVQCQQGLRADTCLYPASGSGLGDTELWGGWDGFAPLPTNAEQSVRCKAMISERAEVSFRVVLCPAGHCTLCIIIKKILFFFFSPLIAFTFSTGKAAARPGVPSPALSLTWDVLQPQQLQ